MFSKLAFRNVRRSFRDYGVYLLTLTFGVCLFYTFNSLDGQGAMIYLAQSQNPMAQVIQSCIDIFSVFVAVVLACLILYANSFLLRRRKRELGTYLLLGLSQGQVSRLLFLETGLIGLASLVLGLGLGLLASQGLSALTLSMFSLRVDAFGLAFSPRAVVRTAVYFGLIFLLVMVFSGLQVSRAKLLDLMQSGRRNEELHLRPLWVSVVQFAAGVVCLLIAYAILLIFGMAYAIILPMLCIPMLGLGTLGTLLVFKSLSGFVLRLVQSRPKLYFKNLNVFTLRQWISKVHSTYLAQTVICILLLLAMGITASSIGLNNTIESMTGRQAPFDITVQNQNADSQGTIDFPALLAQHGVEESDLAWQQDTIFYYNDPAVTGIEDASAAIRLSDCQALLSRSGQPAYRGPVPGPLTGVEEQLTTGNLGLSCVVVPDEMAQKLEAHLPAGRRGGAGPPAAEPGGGQRRPVRHPPPPGGGGEAGLPLRCGAGGPCLPPAPGAGPGPHGGGHEGGQRPDRPGGQGGLGAERPGHRPGAAAGVRRLLPGHLPGLPEAGPGPLIFSSDELSKNRGHGLWPCPLSVSKKALLQGVPPSADGGIKFNPVLSEDMRLGKDSSHEILADNFARNRGQNFVQPFSKKWLCHFFDRKKGHGRQPCPLLLPRGEQPVHRHSQLPGQAEGQGEGGVVLVVLNGVDGLPGHAAPPGQVLLGDAPLLPQRPDLIFHSSSPSVLVLEPAQEDGVHQGCHHQPDKGCHRLPVGLLHRHLDELDQVCPHRGDEGPGARLAHNQLPPLVLQLGPDQRDEHPDNQDHRQHQKRQK